MSCEWSPSHNAPALDGDPHGATRATLAVGQNGQWHLCAGCAALPRFKRMKKRPLRGGHVNVQVGSASCAFVSTEPMRCPLCGADVPANSEHTCSHGNRR